MPFSIFALFYLLPRLYNKDSWSLFCETFSLLEGCFDPSWRITLETKANKKLSHFRADSFAITLEQKIRSSRPALDPKVSSWTCAPNIIYKADFYWEYLEIQRIHKCVPILFFIPQQIQKHLASKTNKTENIFPPWKWLAAWTSQLFRFSRVSLCLESMRAVVMHSWTHFFYKFVQDNSTFCLRKFRLSIVWAQKFSKCIN